MQNTLSLSIENTEINVGMNRQFIVFSLYNITKYFTYILVDLNIQNVGKIITTLKCVL